MLNVNSRGHVRCFCRFNGPCAQLTLALSFLTMSCERFNITAKQLTLAAFVRKQS